MTERLDLTPEQNIDVKAINLKYAKKMQNIRNQARSMYKLNDMKSLNKDKGAEMKKVLSAKQYEDYEKMMAEMKNKTRSGRG